MAAIHGLMGRSLEAKLRRLTARPPEGHFQFQLSRKPWTTLGVGLVSDASNISVASPRPPRRLARLVRRALLASVLCAVGVELNARYVLGLGTPALSITHPTIEYMFAPNQDLLRFGKRFITNEWGMRSHNFPAHKEDRREYRVLVFGDSVVNGGNLTDHEELATTLLQAKLREQLQSAVIVGNVSAGSWGPGNWLAYAKEFGFFDADCVLLVVNSGDAADCPTFEPLNPDTHPTEAPWFATSELFSRYLPRYLPSWSSPSAEVAPQPANDQELSRRGLADLREFLQLAHEAAKEVVVIQYLDREEIESSTTEPGYEQIASVCQELMIPVSSTRKYFTGIDSSSLFRDAIHPNAKGQQRLFDAMLDCISGALPKAKQPVGALSGAAQ